MGLLSKCGDEDTPDERETKMTNPEMLKIAAIKAILEAIEEGDEDDAKEAMATIRALLVKADK